MSEESKKARNAMKEKAKRLAHGDPHQKVDSSTWTPGEPINADIKTGMRPISKRAFKKGGKVLGHADGKKAEFRADRKPRASGGKLDRYVKAATKDQINTMENMDYENINPKDVAKTRKREHGINLATSKIGGSSQKNYDDKKMFGTEAKKGSFKAKIPATDVSKDLKNDYKGRAYTMEEYTPLPAKFARKEGGRATRYLTPDNLINRDQKMANEERDGIKHIGGLKTGGRTKKFGGGPIGQNPIGQQNQMMGQAAGMSPIVRKHGGKTSHPDEAADKALIKKMVKPEARKAHGGKIHDHDCTCHKCWGGRTGKEKGGEVFSGAGYPFKVPGATGGRSAHAAGGKAKGKTNINIIIGAHPHNQSGGGIPPNAPMPAPNAGRPPAVPMPMPMPPAGGGMPMGAAPPMGGAPGGMPMGAPPMPRKSGGRTNYPIHDGAGGGEGRLEKIKSYGMKPSR